MKDKIPWAVKDYSLFRTTDHITQSHTYTHTHTEQRVSAWIKGNWAIEQYSYGASRSSWHEYSLFGALSTRTELETNAKHLRASRCVSLYLHIIRTFWDKRRKPQCVCMSRICVFGRWAVSINKSLLIYCSCASLDCNTHAHTQKTIVPHDCQYFWVIKLLDSWPRTDFFSILHSSFHTSQRVSL